MIYMVKGREYGKYEACRLDLGREKPWCCGGEGSLSAERIEREREYPVSFAQEKHLPKPLTVELKGNEHCKFLQAVCGAQILRV